MGTSVENRSRTKATRFAEAGLAGGDKESPCKDCEISSGSFRGGEGEGGSKELSREWGEPEPDEDPYAGDVGAVIGGGSFQR